MLRKYAVIACLFISACTLIGPDYKEPKTKVTEHWAKKDSSVSEKAFKPDGWWHLFQDKNLTDLVEEGYHNNLSVHMAGTRVLQARAQLARSVGQLYPQQQTMNGNYLAYRMGGSYLEDVLPTTFDAALLGFSANWEADFWGKFRRAVRASDANFMASITAYEDALVTLTSDIASNYIGIRASEAMIDIVQQNIKLQRHSLRLTESRYRAGSVSMLDVQEAKTQLSETEAMLPSLVSELQVQKDGLAVMLGTVPSEVDAKLKKHHGIPKAPSSIEVGIPREMLVRRPDVRQARLDAILNSELIGVAKGELFPALSIGGSFYFAGNTINGNTISQMFNWSNRNYTAGPGLNWPILNYGQLTNMVRIADAAYQEKLLNYMNTVLTAQQEVQDEITRYIETKKAVKSYQNAVHSAIDATRLTRIQYTEGDTNYTTVLFAQQQQLYTQISLIKAEADLPRTLVRLYRALGGGWEIRGKDDFVPESIKQEMAKRVYWGGLLKQENHEIPKTKQARIEALYFPNW